MGYLLVALGGMVGSVARYGLSTWIHSRLGYAFPWGTLAVNIVASFVVGLVMALSLDRAMLSPETRTLVTTGFCGGLSTFSTFSYETVVLMRSGEWLFAGANVVFNLIVCFAAAALGLWAARAF